MPPGERLLSIARVAELLDVSTRTVRRMWEAGELPPPRRMRAGLRWFQTDIDYYLAGLRLQRPPQLGNDRD
jgi:excisionase family DNA binding protein